MNIGAIESLCFLWNVMVQITFLFSMILEHLNNISMYLKDCFKSILLFDVQKLQNPDKN